MAAPATGSVVTDPPATGSVDTDPAGAAGTDDANLQAQLAAALAQVETLKTDKAAQGQTNASLHQRLRDLEKSIKDGKDQQLESQEQYKTLWEQLKVTHAALEKERDDLRSELITTKTEKEQEKLKADALAIIAPVAVNGEQLYDLLSRDVRSKDGKVVILAGGVERDLAAYLTALSAPGTGWDHHFRAGSVRGMGSAGTAAAGAAAGGASGDAENPWSKAGWSRTGQLHLLGTNPDLAAEYQAAAAQES